MPVMMFSLYPLLDKCQSTPQSQSFSHKGQHPGSPFSSAPANMTNSMTGAEFHHHLESHRLRFRCCTDPVESNLEEGVQK